MLVIALVPIALIDLDVRLIPNVITGPAAIAALVAGLALDIDFVPEQLIAAAAAFAFFFLAAWLYPREWAWPTSSSPACSVSISGRAVAPAIFIALILGVVVGTVVIARVGQEGRREDGGAVWAVFGDWRDDRFLRRQRHHGRIPRSFLTGSGVWLCDG